DLASVALARLRCGNIAKPASVLRYDVTIPGVLRRDAGGNTRPLRVDTTFRAFRNATYVQGTWQATQALGLSGGLRGDYYDFLSGRSCFAEGERDVGR
ncbi:MAG: hypothetical protein IPN16_16565, partial [Gemmatimonadetes bacterium]|nr:hypothetical protein [Gemmatimonadota bacterium]